MNRLFEQLPPFFQGIREFSAVFQAVSGELDLLRGEIRQTKENFFVETANEAGLQRMAKSLRLEGNGEENLRFALRAACLEKRPYTMCMLENAMNTLLSPADYTLSREISSGVIKLCADLGERTQWEAVRHFLDKILPADMKIESEALYNTHQVLSGRTHEELSEMIHDEVRSEKI